MAYKSYLGVFFVRGSLLSFWFLIWLVLCGILLYFYGWTNFILYRQKKAWKVYAQKYNLRYKSKTLMSSPELNGSIEGYTIGLFTGEHAARDGRSMRKLVAIEMELHSNFPMNGVLASGGMVELVQGVPEFKFEVEVPSKDWDSAYIARTDNINAFEQYISEERLRSLVSLMKEELTWIVFVFREGNTLLRLDTPLPLDHPKTLDKTIKSLLKTASLLELQKGENASLLQAKAQSETVSTLSVKEEELEKTAFELEDEAEEKEAEEKAEGEEEEEEEEEESLDKNSEDKTR